MKLYLLIILLNPYGHHLDAIIQEYPTLAQCETSAAMVENIGAHVAQEVGINYVYSTECREVYR